ARRASRRAPASRHRPPHALGDTDRVHRLGDVVGADERGAAEHRCRRRRQGAGQPRGRILAPGDGAHEGLARDADAERPADTGTGSFAASIPTARTSRSVSSPSLMPVFKYGALERAPTSISAAPASTMPSAAFSTASSPWYTDPAWKDSGLTLITPMTATGDASPSMTPASSARDRRDMSHDTIRPAPTAASAG